jgi:hypothetical protein
MIALKRLYQQRLTANPFETPEEVVAWLGAVQAQEYGLSKWALALRMRDATDDLIEQASNEGRILRTHIMRPTWHFVTPADIRWIMELTAPRVHALNAYMYRKLELDKTLLTRCNDLLAKALEGGQHCTRQELGKMLAQHGINANGFRLGYIVHHAELDAVVCSGPRHGKQFTYALLDERAPHAKRLPREEALVELIRRYYTSHGPATVHDFAWWSGLTMADVKAGIEILSSELACEIIDGTPYWFSASMPPVAKPSSDAFLLPVYDEMLIGYASFDKSRTAGQDLSDDIVFFSMIMVEGKMIGSWRRTFKKSAVVIEVASFAPLTPIQEKAVDAATERYGNFMGMPVLLG